MATITKGATVITPALVLASGLESTQDAATIEHVNLVGNVSYSLRADLPRSGVLEFFFLNETDAEAARAAHSTPGVFVLAYPERPSWEMSYVRKGALKLKLEQDTLTRWVLEVGFSEVTS